MKSLASLVSFITLVLFVFGHAAHAAPTDFREPLSKIVDIPTTQPTPVVNQAKVLDPVTADTLLRRGDVQDDTVKPDVADDTATTPALSLSQADTLLRRTHVPTSTGASTGQLLQLNNADTPLRGGHVKDADDTSSATEPAGTNVTTTESSLPSSQADTSDNASAASDGTADQPLHLSEADTLLRRGHVKDTDDTSTTGNSSTTDNAFATNNISATDGAASTDDASDIDVTSATDDASATAGPAVAYDATTQPTNVDTLLPRNHVKNKAGASAPAESDDDTAVDEATSATEPALGLSNADTLL